ncbi:ArsR family transcription regulator [Halobacterium hubeiense]|uniref:ArsR family transcription regulator n=1 Tax=Halobacterium hubeiense TaxID=1407499 RepID=A0A0U5AC97_9EURY|nr:helix-turn-helix domain-containing protein [Halobacterium hubeiense]CQH51461.1 ArsR family transcription regulator [Halobacterium hubeiense]
MAENRLLPSRSTVERGDGSRVVGIREDAAAEVFEALSSSTAREILAALYEEPDTASSVAEQCDTSLQNATYHLEKLVDAELVEVADTWYSEQGREMNVYAPASESLVVFAADEASKPSLKDRLLRVLGAVGFLGVASLVVQRLFGGQASPDYQTTGGDAGGATPAPATTQGGDVGIMNEQATETAQATTTAASNVTQQASQSAAQSLPPGVLFFAGGLLVLAVVFAYVWYRRR